MNGKEAMKALCEGKKIQRDIWKKLLNVDSYIYISEDGMIYQYINGYHYPYLFNMNNNYVLYEEKEEILDKEEKEYLSNVIKPFRDKVLYIIKSSMIVSDDAYISIAIKDDTMISLPNFKATNMYKKMELDKLYTLKELGL